MIDHTFLRPYCQTTDEIEKLCREARQYGFATVAVNPAQVEECCQLLQDTYVQVGAAIGFPLGQTTCATKMYEARDAIQRGAAEIDMVINLRDLQTRNYAAVREEVEGLVAICQSSSVICKIILETCYLTNEDIVKGCEICRDARVDFVKTSTGFGPSEAKVEDVKLMRETVGTAVGVKAAGGIRKLETVRAIIAAGATRIGTSSGVSIMEELLAEQRLENERK